MQLHGLGQRLANVVGLSRGAAGQATPLLPQEQVSIQGPLRLHFGDGPPISLPGEGQTLTLGRGSDNGAVISDSGVSRNHAAMTCSGGQYYIRDLGSRNGTQVNGRPVGSQWVPLPLNGQIKLGQNVSGAVQAAPVAPPAQEARIPDGRTVLITNLPGGHLKVSKLDFTVARDKFNPQDFYDLHAGKPPGAQPAIGEKLVQLKGGRIQHVEYLGDDVQGQMRFGHTNEYTPESWSKYITSQQAEIDRRAEAAEAKARKRGEGAAHLRQQEMARIGLRPEHLADPAGAARLLLQHDAKLGYDGTDLWPREVQSEVMGQKRAQLEATPEIAGKGLVDIRLQEFMADRRGEFVLYRGLKGEYNPADPGSFYTTDPGCALGTYAKDETSKSCVIATRVPQSDAFGYYRDVGLVPGRNKYAEVYDISSADLKQYDKPYVVMDSDRQDQRWMFDEMKANGQMDNGDRGLTDYFRIVANIQGRSPGS
ncbi:MAG TPA: FHA domain-containing protein [Candidatus Xenobia bacterium]|jgi:pSer/pThr/pTyr-binding forkhead associated (FHA) protein